MNIYYDKCFLNGELVNFKDLPNEIKYNKGRLSFTSLNTLNFCPFRFNNETWEDIGLSENDNSAHGTFGHYIMQEYIRYLGKDIDLERFSTEAMFLASKSITKNKNKAREEVDKSDNYTSSYFKSTLRKMYVSKSFDIKKYLEKVKGYLNHITNFNYYVNLKKVKNIYLESGIFVVTSKGNIVFGKADVIIEYLDGTWSIIDHKSSFNTMYFNSMQLKVYARLLKKPIKRLSIYELSSGNIFNYNDNDLSEADSFIKSGLKYYTSGSDKINIGEHCNGCPVSCISAQVDDDGYAII